MTPKVREALRAAGAELVRSRRHYVFRLANGEIVGLAKTPGDCRHERNALMKIRHAVERGERRAEV